VCIRGKIQVKKCYQMSWKSFFSSILFFTRIVELLGFWGSVRLPFRQLVHVFPRVPVVLDKPACHDILSKLVSMKALENIISELYMKPQSIPQFQGLRLGLANLGHQLYPDILKWIMISMISMICHYNRSSSYQPFPPFHQLFLLGLEHPVES